MNLRFLPAAREELDAAASYLEDRVTGLGIEFLATWSVQARFWTNLPKLGDDWIRCIAKFR